MPQVARARTAASKSSALLRAPQQGYSSGNQQSQDQPPNRFFVLASLFGGVVALAHLKGQDPAQHLRGHIGSFLPSSALKTAECAAGTGFSDKNLDDFKDKVNEGIEKLVAKDPNVQRVKLVSGLRGTKYFVEFPIAARNVDSCSLFQKVQQKLEKGKGNKYNVRVTQTDSYL